MHGSRKEKRSLCMYVCSFNIQLAFNLSVVTHKTVHTSEHNDWLWKTVRYMVQPYKIKSYSRAQHAQHLIPLRFWFNTPYASAVWKECGPNVYTLVSIYVCENSPALLSCSSALTDNFPFVLFERHLLRIPRRCGILSTDTVFHSFKPEFPLVSLSFARSFIVANVVLVSWNGGEVNEPPSEWMVGWMNGWMLGKVETSAFRLTRMRYGTINMSQGIWFNSSTSNERSLGRTSKHDKTRRGAVAFFGAAYTQNSKNWKTETFQIRMNFKLSHQNQTNWKWRCVMVLRIEFGKKCGKRIWIHSRDLPFVLLCLKQYQWFWHYYSFLKTSNWWVYFIRFTDKR